MKFHMKRTDKEITDKNVLKRILKYSKYVTLALAVDNQPYLVSLSHGYDEVQNCIFFHCASHGKKLHMLQVNNVVWGQALLDYGYASGKCTHFYASVHFLGKVTFIKDINEKRKVMVRVMKHLDNNPEVLIQRLQSERLRNTVIGRVDIQEIFGKKSTEVAI